MELRDRAFKERKFALVRSIYSNEKSVGDHFRPALSKQRPNQTTPDNAPSECSRLQISVRHRK